MSPSGSGSRSRHSSSRSRRSSSSSSSKMWFQGVPICPGARDEIFRCRCFSTCPEQTPTSYFSGTPMGPKVEESIGKGLFFGV